MLIYPVTLSTDSNGEVLVDFLDIPFCHSTGDDEEEASRRMRWKRRWGYFSTKSAPCRYRPPQHQDSPWCACRH